MKKYGKPLVTNFNDGNFALPAIGGIIAAVAVAKVLNKAVDKLFQSAFANAERLEALEPVIA